MQEFSADLRQLGADMAGWPEEKRQRALAMVVHACDIGNPAKPLPLCLQWTQHIIAENFAQAGLWPFVVSPALRGIPRACAVQTPDSSPRMPISVEVCMAYCQWIPVCFPLTWSKDCRDLGFWGACNKPYFPARLSKDCRGLGFWGACNKP